MPILQQSKMPKKQQKTLAVYTKESLFYNTPSNNLIETFKVGQLKENNLINFASGTPSEDVYPFEIFKKLYCDVLEEYGPKIMLYHPTQGLEELREVIKKSVEKKGIFVSKDDIQITSGSQQALDLILKTLSSKRKNKIVVGNPTYHGALNTFKTNCKIYPVEMEKDGFNLIQLENILSEEKITFIYTTMDFSCPTGISWSEEKKQQLILLAKKYNTLIIEDDFASELSFYNTPRTSIKSLDSDNKTVIYIKSFSKIIMPGLRLAYMIAPTELISKIVTVKFTTDISTPALEQKVLANFLKGNFTQFMRRDQAVINFSWRLFSRGHFFSSFLIICYNFIHPLFQLALCFLLRRAKFFFFSRGSCQICFWSSK